MKSLSFILLLFITLACSQSEVTPSSLPEQIDALIQADNYTDALSILEDKEETEEVLLLKEKTHLNYGLYLVYRDADVSSMRDKMNAGLRQYIEVLKINLENEKAMSEIEQILGIYSTFPDRSPEEDVLNDLRELGFNI